MDQNRDFYIWWCGLLSGYAESYFEKLPDQELEAKYLELLGEATKEIEEERG